MHETLETTIQKPHQLEDGTHVIPIHRVRFSGCESYKAATGVVHWNMERGVSFNINFPDVHQFDLSSYWQPAANFAGVGRFSPHSQVPSWTAETAEGHAVRLYGTCDKPTSRIHYGTNGSGHSSSVSGSVMFAEINLPASNPLSFFNATLPHPRMLFIGHGIRHWTSVEPVEFSYDGGTTTTNRCTVPLNETPDVRIVGADARINLPTAGWLTFDPNQDIESLSFPCSSERSFMSFLNGRSVPFMWMDVFPREDIVRRVYFGWSRIQKEDTDFTDTEPLPMCGSVESFQFGQEVTNRLPDLFRRWVSLNSQFEFAWVLSPLWTARRSFLDDKVALASISLERLAAEWGAFRKRSNAHESESGIWQDQKLTDLKRRLLTVVDEFELPENHNEGACTSTNDFREALNKVRNQIHGSLFGPGNRDKLTRVFQDLNLPISETERKTINFRNKALHGNRTLGGHHTSDFDDDAHRYDILRMLVTKAILGILRYDGPFMNYAGRPESGNFPVESLQLGTTPDLLSFIPDLPSHPPASSKSS